VLLFLLPLLVAPAKPSTVVAQEHGDFLRVVAVKKK